MVLAEQTRQSVSGLSCELCDPRRSALVGVAAGQAQSRFASQPVAPLASGDGHDGWMAALAGSFFASEGLCRHCYCRVCNVCNAISSRAPGVHSISESRPIVLHWLGVLAVGAETTRYPMSYCRNL